MRTARAAHASSPRELDELALQRARRGDSASFRVLVECYHRAVYAFLWRMVEPALGDARVEDLAQETFLRVYRALPRFQPQGSAKLSTWILTIATRLALSELRRASRREAAWDELDEDALTTDERDGVDVAIDRQRLAYAVRRAVASLPAPFRAALVLREYHELDYGSIAEALGTTRGTVKSRIARARARVRKLVEEAEDG